MSLSRYEQETIITFNEDEPIADVFTYNRKLKHRLEKLYEQYPNDIKTYKNNGADGVTYYVPKGWIKINPSLNLTEEERQKRAEQMRERLKAKT